MTEPDERSTLALDVMQAALSLAVKHFAEGARITDTDIERAAELFGVGAEDADQILLIHGMLIAFGNSVASFADRVPLGKP